MIRRELLKLGGVATVGLALPSSLFAAHGERPADLVVADDRFAAGSAFADSAGKAGAQVFATGGDLASLWHGRLRGAPLAGLKGLTSYADMVVAAGLVAEARRSFALRIAHHGGSGGPNHELAVGLPAHVGVLQAAGEEWPLALWSVMARQHLTDFQPEVRCADVCGRRGALWSWAIA